MVQIKLAIIGCGKWGMNHVRTAHKILGKQLIWCCDTSPDCETPVKKISGDIKFTTNINDILSDKTINAVIVSTSAETHYQITKEQSLLHQ